MNILTHPSDVLRSMAVEIVEFGPALERSGLDMLETMYAADGIGLAAPQVGAPQRMIVADVSGGYDEIVMVNPVIVSSSGTITTDEGCLSLPGQTVRVCRAREVLVSYKDCLGHEQEKALSGLLAVVVQHEIDHLDGILMIDHR